MLLFAHFSTAETNPWLAGDLLGALFWRPFSGDPVDPFLESKYLVSNSLSHYHNPVFLPVLCSHRPFELQPVPFSALLTQPDEVVSISNPTLQKKTRSWVYYSRFNKKAPDLITAGINESRSQLCRRGPPPDPRLSRSWPCHHQSDGILSMFVGKTL